MQHNASSTAFTRATLKVWPRVGGGGHGDHGDDDDEGKHDDDDDDGDEDATNMA